VFSAIDENGQSQLWLRRLDELDSRAIAGTARAVSPFFSPDSRSIGFIVDGQLRRLSLTGGLSSTILNTPGPTLRGAYWTAAGTILLGALPGIAISEIADGGGSLREVTTPIPGDGDQTHRFPVSHTESSIQIPDGEESG
jgi:eukaryotic-like serine/threonine-protein kinase